MPRKYRNVVTNPTNKHLYSIYKNMKVRCYDKECERYNDYGGRGIYVCLEWVEDFDCFADWAKSNGYKEGLTIDRINNNKGYEPDNCRWITKKEQNLNKRTTLYVTYHGVEKPLKTWCEELDLPYDSVHNRIYHIGMSIEDAFEKPFEKVSFSQLCREHNINAGTARDRILKFGWTVEQALNTPSMGRGTNRCILSHDYGEDICKVCGTKFKKNNHKQIYCCEKCRNISKSVSYKRRKEMQSPI